MHDDELTLTGNTRLATVRDIRVHQTPFTGRDFDEYRRKRPRVARKLLTVADEMELQRRHAKAGSVAA